MFTLSDAHVRALLHHFEALEDDGLTPILDDVLLEVRGWVNGIGESPLPMTDGEYQEMLEERQDS